jgi:hypothetical protein
MEEKIMKTRKPLIISLGLVLILTATVGGYISVNNIELPGIPVTMNVVDGTNSYFIANLSNVPAGLDVTNGVYPGWCIQRFVHMPRSTNLQVRLYDSYDPALPAAFQDPDWDKVNWILNNKDGYSMATIQWAIWNLIDESDISARPSSQTLVASAVDGFIPQSGDIIAIVAVPERTDAQCSIIELRIPSNYEGLTPGFWKNHESAWNDPYHPSDSVGSVFNIPNTLNDLSSDTLLQALQYKGGNNNYGAARILLRSAVAALLNDVHPSIDYPWTSSKIIQEVNKALNDDRTAMLELKDILDGYNNLGAEL